jgi:hypothetical protein
LSAVAELAKEFGSVDAFLREFLDEFYGESDVGKRQQMLTQEPVCTSNARSNAYFAAVAEHLALKYGLTIPEWATQEERFLHMPFFPAGLESLKATLLKVSPTAFRRRMIFVDADPLYRPRRDKMGIG